MILTQMPLDNTKDDFWALIKEHNVHTVVMLNNLTETEVCVTQSKFQTSEDFVSVLLYIRIWVLRRTRYSCARPCYKKKHLEHSHRFQI